jgi:hypothetical protein
MFRHGTTRILRRELDPSKSNRHRVEKRSVMCRHIEPSSFEGRGWRILWRSRPLEAAAGGARKALPLVGGLVTCSIRATRILDAI